MLTVAETMQACLGFLFFETEEAAKHFRVHAAFLIDHSLPFPVIKSDVPGSGIRLSDRLLQLPRINITPPRATRRYLDIPWNLPT